MKTEKQDSKDRKVSDDKGKTGKPTAEQEDKPPPLPSAYDEDLMLRAAMYGVLFQAYADKASHSFLCALTLVLVQFVQVHPSGSARKEKSQI